MCIPGNAADLCYHIRPDPLNPTALLQILSRPISQNLASNNIVSLQDKMQLLQIIAIFYTPLYLHRPRINGSSNECQYELRSSFSSSHILYTYISYVYESPIYGRHRRKSESVKKKAEERRKQINERKRITGAILRASISEYRTQKNQWVADTSFFFFFQGLCVYYDVNGRATSAKKGDTNFLPSKAIDSPPPTDVRLRQRDNTRPSVAKGLIAFGDRAKPL